MCDVGRQLVGGNVYQQLVRRKRNTRIPKFHNATRKIPNMDIGSRQYFDLISCLVFRIVCVYYTNKDEYVVWWQLENSFTFKSDINYDVRDIEDD